MAGHERDRDSLLLQWNELLDFKIDENSMRRPDFKFFYGALESLLRALNFNIDEIKPTTAEGDAERVFYIRFCQGVHNLYHSFDPSFHFAYYDLIMPSSSKVKHVLKSLFNYLLYYNMVKSKVCAKANEVLKAYDDVLKVNNNLLATNEKVKKRTANVDRLLMEYEEKLPVLKETLQELEAKEKQLDRENKRIVDEVKDFDLSLMQLEIKETELNDLVVNEEEYKKKAETVSKMKNELAELEAVAEHTRSSNLATEIQINELNKSIDGLKKILETHLLSHFEDLVDAEANLSTLKQEIGLIKTIITETKQNDRIKQEDVDKLITDIRQKEDELQRMQTETAEQTKKLKEEKLETEKKIAAADTESIDLQTQIDELKAQQKFIKESFKTLLQRVSKPFAA